jgi:cytochrome c oxidase cbb3-type subunit 2
VNFGPLIFLAAFLAMGASWFGFVLRPEVELGTLRQTNSLAGDGVYPQPRPGLARAGLQVYRANGCAYCHSQQVDQTGTVADLIVTETGSNLPAVVAIVSALDTTLTENGANTLLSRLPARVAEGASKEQADAVAARLKKKGAKSQVVVRPTGADIQRGWGFRHSVARDFLYDAPALVGSQRVGPDLSNIGLRNNDPIWHLVHLYSPGSKAPGSLMPPYRFLFEKQRIGLHPSPDALPLEGALAPEPGFEVVPRDEARALVAYLLSLRPDSALIEAPWSQPEQIKPPEIETNSTTPAK